MTTTPDRDVTARALAERILSSYMQRAEGSTHPQQEQTLLARLAEGLKAAKPEEAVAAANDVLDSWERADPVRGPRIQSVDIPAMTVTLKAEP